MSKFIIYRQIAQKFWWFCRDTACRVR